MLFPFGILQTTKPDSFLIIPGFPSPRPVFEYTLNFLSVFYVIKNTENMKPFANYFTKTKQNHVIVWTVDTINPDFQADSMKPIFFTKKKKKKKHFFSTVRTFKPVAPLSIHYKFYPSFIYANDDGSVMLFY